jgi:transcriptional regulator with XRE-family HTH domain
MTDNSLFSDIVGETPPEVARFVDKSMDIADQIVAILKAKSWTVKQLADALGKREVVVSKWLTGTHNFTLRSIARIETALGADIIVTPLSHQEQK